MNNILKKTIGATLDKWLTAVRKALESPLGSDSDPMAAYYDDELMEVSGGWLIFADPCSDKKTKDSCKKANCSWNSSTSKCEGGL